MFNANETAFLNRLYDEIRIILRVPIALVWAAGIKPKLPPCRAVTLPQPTDLNHPKPGTRKDT